MCRDRKAADKAIAPGQAGAKGRETAGGPGSAKGRETAGGPGSAIEARLGALNRGEVLHYLGYAGQAIEPALDAQIDRCMQLVTEACVPRLIWVREPVDLAENACRSAGAERDPQAGSRDLQAGNRDPKSQAGSRDLAESSRDLKELLVGCREQILLAATIGAAVDQLIRRHEITDMGDALIMDACASAAIENMCDNAEHDMREMLRAEGLYLSDRFSPGYGDLPLTAQRGLCARLDTGRKIGLTLTESGLMLPRKSVTAIMGVSEQPVRRRARGCETCSLGADCPYRRAGSVCGAVEL